MKAGEPSRTGPSAEDRREPPYRISVIGAGDASDSVYRLARELGAELGRAGALVVTGGLGGVMEAASRGCREAGGMTLAFLPGNGPEEANPWVTYPLATGMGEGRNLLVVRAGEAVIAVGGGWGTLSELALARKMGREVAFLGDASWALPLPAFRSGVEAARWAMGTAAESRV